MDEEAKKIVKIGIASDHRGVEVKQEIIRDLETLGYEVFNFGTNTEESVDYPEYAFKVGESVVQKKVDLGIVICGTGIGMCIACNKVKGVRCAKVTTKEEVIATRNDNDSNIIDYVKDNFNLEINKMFLQKRRDSLRERKIK